MGLEVDDASVGLTDLVLVFGLISDTEDAVTHVIGAIHAGDERACRGHRSEQQGTESSSAGFFLLYQRSTSESSGNAKTASDRACPIMSDAGQDILRGLFHSELPFLKTVKC